MSDITFDQVTQGGTVAPEPKESFFDKYAKDDFSDEQIDQSQDGDSEETTDAQTGEQENPDTEEAEQEVKTETEEATTPELSFKGVKPNVVAKMKQYAAANGYDLTDPKDFKLLRMISEQQVQIENAKLSVPSPKADDYLAELEAKFSDPTPEKKPEAEGKVDEPEFLRLYKSFKNEEDWFTNHEDAWAKVGDAKTPEDRKAAIAAINNSHMAFLENAFMSRYGPMLMQFIEQEFGQRLKPVIQEASSRERQTLRETVMADLSELPQFEGIQKILEKSSDEPFIYDGQEWDDTPLNRVVALNPSIQKIKGKNPRHTLALQLSKAFELSKGLRTTKPKPDMSVKAAIKVGEKIAESKQKTSPVRQGLNGGKTGLSAESKRSRIADSWTPDDDGPSFSSLFK